MKSDVPLLMAPGPVEVDQKVYDVMSKRIMHHRTPPFGEVYREISKKAGLFFGTKNDVYMLTSSGTGAIEASVCNMVNKGDKVLSVSIGKFGERFHKICLQYGADATFLQAKDGSGVTPKTVRKMLDETGAEIITITHNETSTATTNPIGEIAKEVADDALMLVDGVSSIGGIPYHHDDWGTAISFTGSQKALGVPPGLAFITIADKAWDKIEKCTSPKYYFDLKKSKDFLDKKGQTPYTPAISIALATNKALDLLLEDGVEATFKKQETIAKSVWAGGKAMGLDFFAEEEYRSKMLTAFNAPPEIDTEAMRKILKEKYNVQVAGGQDHLKGKIFRIGHMGAIGEKEIIQTFEGLVASFKEVGYESKDDPIPAIKEVFNND
ncbi:pyridoxal-phosphate-dependent aminotransferase family protein [Candidatus Undinarchaeota archaeon]